MAKKVFQYIFSVSILVVILTTFFIVQEMYQSFTNSQLELLKGETKLVAYGINSDGLHFIDKLDDADYRITIINNKGTVIYDNIDSDVVAMDNHLNRQEVKMALETGYGNSIRQSSTLTEKYIYTAMVLDDGNIVRLANTYPSIFHFVGIIAQPLLLIILLIIMISVYIAYKLAFRIVQPLNEIDTDNPKEIPYNEIKPIMDKLSVQRRLIEEDKNTLKRKRQEFEAITANMTEGLVLINDLLQVIDINKSGKAILETDESIIGKSITEIKNYSLFSSLITSHEHIQRDSKTIKIDNKSYIVETSPVQVDGVAVGTVLLFFDNTLKEANEVFRKEFASNVSHELKTPLQAISGYSELLKNGIIQPDDQKECAEKIYLESLRMQKLIEDIIKLSHLDDDELQINKETIDLDEQCLNIIETIRNDNIRDVEVIYNGQKELIFVNKGLLESTIYNLVENAIRYNVDNGKVYVRVYDKDNKVYLEVEDTGIGIDKSEFDRIYERFYRIDKGRSKNTGGTGLGLSIVKHACILNNAEIKLESEINKGSKFTIIFNKA